MRTTRVLSCLVVDDEPPALTEMRRLLSLYPDVEVAGEAATVARALALTASLRPDAVFLDVKLRGETGFDYVGRLTEPQPHLVFVTAYDRYAIRGFECNALDYLLKPVLPERLTETIRRLRSRTALERAPAAADDVVFIKSVKSARFVPWREVQGIESLGNYTRVHLAADPAMVVLRPLKEWLPLMPEGMFQRVHRTAVVQREAIREIRFLGGKKWELTLSNGTVAPVGRIYLPALRMILEKR